MNEMTIILEKIREYPRIAIFRHIRPDGDCVGSTKGLKEIILATWPEKDVRIIDSQHSDFLAFLGPDDEEVPDEWYLDALAIALDTGTAKRISNQKFRLCRELIKIDHHIPVDNYGDYAWVEEERSSACEMVVSFWHAFSDELKLTPRAAEALYTGMVTDSGRFKFSSVSPETMRCAALLLEQGIDTERIFANLYLEDFSYLRFKAEMYNHIEVTENGVAWLYISRAMQEQFGMSLEQASASVSFMERIRGCLCWAAFIENGDEEGSIRVRLRSRYVAINGVAERYRGGGHACASGATVYSPQEVQALLTEADELVKAYKETHEDWL